MCPAQAYPLKALSFIPQALLVYRVFRKEAKRTTKVLHGLLHVVAFIIALVGEFLGTAFVSICCFRIYSPYFRLLGPPPRSSLQASQAGTLDAGHHQAGPKPRSSG